MKISLGSDHAGFLYKEKVKELLGSLGHEVKDFGTFSEEPVDYPLFIRPAVEAVARGECERGIVFGGSGNGEAMVANKVHGVRCALCWNLESAQLSRKHNDANVLSLGERLIEENLALEIVRVWLTTEFEGGRHAPRVVMLSGIDQIKATHPTNHSKGKDERRQFHSARLRDPGRDWCNPERETEKKVRRVSKMFGN